MKRIINVSMILVLLLGFLPARSAVAEALLLWEQLPIEVNDATSSYDSQLIADDFILTEASSINQIEIWNRMAAPVETYYYIYANALVNGVNVPGETLANGMLTPSVTVEDATICDYYACAYRHTLNLASPIELEPGHYWLSVFGWYGSGFSWSYAYAPADLPTFAWKYVAGPWTGTFEGGLAFRLLGPQVCSASIEVQNSNDSGTGSLRQAIIDICPGGTITFNSSLSGAIITLTSQLTLDKDVTIDGSALDEKVSISGNNLVRVFMIINGYTVTMDSLIIANGNHTDTNGNGGGINNQGTLTINNCSLVNNTTSIGGGIYNGNTLFVINSSLMQNTAGAGGALTNVGTATLTGCTISENQAPVGAGIDESYGTLTVTDSTFSANVASSKGGGIYISSGGAQASIFGSTFVNNTAGDMGGGGIVNHGTASLVNSTFTGNVIDPYAYGSAINNHFGTLTLYNSTLSGNTGYSTLNNEMGSMSLANTIIANTISGWDCSTAYGTLTESIDNWVSDGASGDTCGATNFGDPMLGALEDNGGPTQTMALQAGSGAIDAGDDTICSGTLVGGVDQRGIARPQGAYCDIGAYELGPDILPNTLPPATVGFAYSQQLTAVGGTPPYSWSSSYVPDQFYLFYEGELVSYGYHTTPGDFEFIARWHDSASVEFSKDYTLTVYPALTFSPDPLPTGKANETYSQVITLSGGTAPYAITLVNKPEWLSAVTDASAGTVTLSGTPTTVESFTVQLEAADALGVKGAKTFGLWIGPQRAFTWNPDPVYLNQMVTFTPAFEYELYAESWWRGDTCETQIETYSQYAYVTFDEVGDHQICMKYWVASIGDYAWDKQLVTVTRMPPEVWINPEPSFPGEIVHGYIDFYSYGEGSFTCTIDWGDGTTQGPVDPITGENICEVSHSYASAGIYTATATVTEASGFTETASREHHVVYYYTVGPDFWLTSNADPTTITLEAYAAAGHTPLTFTISSTPSAGGLGTPTLIGCYPMDPQVLNSAPISPAISAAGPAPQAVPEGKKPSTDLAALGEIASSNEVLAAESPSVCLANVVYTPTPADPLYVGWDYFSFTVSDGINAPSAASNVELYVDANTPPVAQDSSVEVALDDPTYVILTASDTDHYGYDADRLSFSIDDSLTAGTLGVPSWPDCETNFDEYWNPLGVICTSTVLYTPAAGVTNDSFTFKVNDSHYDSNVATVSLTLHTPTTLTVNVIDDVDNGSCDTHCSLREAILYSGPGDTVNFDLVEQPPVMITLVNRQLVIDNDLTIVGPGADQLSISGGAELMDENPFDHDRVFSIGTWDGAPVNVSISGLTIRDGRSDEGGGVEVYPGNTLYMEDCVIGPNNIVTYAGGGIMNYDGDVTLNRCTVTENEGTGSLGGAGVTTAYGGITTLINSTVSGNITNNFGGGIFVYDATVRLIHTTVSGNISNANYLEGGYEERGGGAGIYFDPYGGGQVELQNSIVAGNTDMWYPEDTIRVLYPDVFGNITSLGGNLIGDPTGSITTWDSSDQVGSAASPLDPLLGALAWNTPGTTQTMALLSGSPAIDAAPTCEVFEDQRGVGRPQGSACDIGAYELEQTTVTGSLKITKVFDPLTSGYVGTFVVKYDCSDEIWGYVDLGAGEATTINDIPTGSQCTVSEVGIPTPPDGWSFGTPIYSPSGTVTISETLSEVTVTNTIIQDVPQTGELVISKTFDALTSGFTDTFTIDYDCDDGTAHDGTVYLAAAGSETISGIPLGTTCTVTEDTIPTPPTGWSFGLPTFAPETGAVTITEASPAYAEVVVTNTISRDTGSLMITKYFDPLTSGYVDTFAINYDCNDGTTHDGTVNLAAGASDTIMDIPTGTICTITEPTLPTAPAGWSFGTPEFNPPDGIVTVVIGTQGANAIMAPAEAWVTVTNTISRDLGELKISKVFDPLTSGFIGDFTITYDCNDGETHDGTVYLGAGESETITGIPTGTSCTVSEASLPTPPNGWTFGTPTYNPADGTVTISKTIAEVTVTNTIVEDVAGTGELKITKIFDPLTSGFIGEFTISYDCDDGTEHDGSVTLAAGASQSITGIPTGTICTVSELSLPTAVEGWIFKAPVMNPVSGTVTISEPSPAFAEVIVTNAIVDVRSQVTTTRTKCSTFAANIAPDLERLIVTTAYNKKTGETYIKKIAPSAFFYYVKALVPAEASVITVSNNPDPFGSPYLIPTTTLYDENCVPLAQTSATISTGPGYSVRIEFPAAASERIIYVGVSYTTKTLAGYVVDTPFEGINYTFTAARDGALFTQDDLLVDYGTINLSIFK